jgi:hypothetical protein
MGNLEDVYPFLHKWALPFSSNWEVWWGREEKEEDFGSFPSPIYYLVGMNGLVTPFKALPFLCFSSLKGDPLFKLLQIGLNGLNPLNLLFYVLKSYKEESFIRGGRGFLEWRKWKKWTSKRVQRSGRTHTSPEG